MKIRSSLPHASGLPLGLYPQSMARGSDGVGLGTAHLGAQQSEFRILHGSGLIWMRGGAR